MTANTSPFDWSGSFSDGEAESAYRTHRLKSDRVLIRIVCSIIVLAVCSFVVSDIRDASARNLALGPLFASRCAIVAFAIFYATVAGYISNIRMLDALTFLLAISMAMVELWVDASRPKDFFTHVGADVLILIGIYLVIPISQSLRLVAAALFTLGLIILYYVYKETPDALTRSSSFLSLVLANVLGVLVTLRMARIQRAEYTALKMEERARQEVEQARSEIRSLSGLIPICAACKKVRNDEGYWEQVESYVRDRSEAKFSHGMCPNCEKKYMI